MNGFTSWLASPFTAGMSAKGWFAFIGLLLCILVVWHFIFAHISRGISAAV